MKRLLIVLFAFIFIFVFISCNDDSTCESSNTSTDISDSSSSNAENSNTIDNNSGNGVESIDSTPASSGGADSDFDTNEAITKYISLGNSKDCVDEFFFLLENSSISTKGLSKEYCYNVTPKEVSDATQMKIFKFVDTCDTFVLIGEEIYTACLSFGGFGFINALPCDYDRDGCVDLLIASSWGSGIHRSEISVFNSVKKESTIIHSTLNDENPSCDLILVPSDNEDEEFLAYYVDSYKDFTFSYLTSEFYGSLVCENDSLVFKYAD